MLKWLFLMELATLCIRRKQNEGYQYEPIKSAKL